MVTSLGAVALFGCSTFHPLATPVAAAQGADLQQRLEALLAEAVNEYRLPGLQAGIRFPDGRILLASAGTEDFARKGRPIDNDTMFRVGSATKMFTAALVLKLRDQGLLSLDQSIDRWFPELPWAKSVTVRELLEHRSGLPEALFSNFGILLESGLNGAKVWKAQDVVDRTMKSLEVAPPGRRKFVYSNNNFVLLGLVAEKVAGKNLGQLLEREFLVPIGMKNTALLPQVGGPKAWLASGIDEYIPLGPHVIGAKTTCWDSLAYAAGGLGSTAADLLRWLDALLDGKAISAASLEEMRSFEDAGHNGRDENIVGYGLGLAHYSLDGLDLEGHPGAGLGGECYPFYETSTGISIVICCNLSRKDNTAGKALLARLFELARSG
jgi:D-alanyl-D-alanine carboxypeptidase